LNERVPPGLQATRAIGVAGTVTTLATLDLGLEEEDPELVHGHVLKTSWVADELARLARTPVAKRRERRGLHPERALVIVAGAVVVLETLRYFGFDELEVSERDIMHGAALAAAKLPAAEQGDAPPGAFVCC
jgi:exopolyphosphatase/guanosine-5'-triphosphate,3'-diphosphate pyrophosphatase